MTRSGVVSFPRPHYLLTRAELEEVWEREKMTADARAISRRGLLYEDYIEGD